MADGKTHYEVLGLAPDATADEIRRRFRELARKYHPDVNPGRADAHERFLRINQAYDVLGDAGRRASYDLNLRDQSRRAADRRGQSNGARGSAPGAGQARPPGGGPFRSGPGPAGGAAGEAAAQRARAERERVERERRHREINRLVTNAHQAYRRGQLREAQRLCEEALGLGRVGVAYELLGDIATRQGQLEAAVRHYTLAAQMAPHQGLVMSKLNRVAARIQQRPGGGDPYDLSELRVNAAARPTNHLLYQLSLTCFGSALILLLVFLSSALKDEPLGWPVIPNWTFYQLALVSLAGILGGALMAIAAWLDPIDQEFLYPSVGTARRGVSLGLLILPVAVLFFPLALVLYVILGAVRGSLSMSVLKLFGATGVLVVGFLLAVPDAAKMETLLFGGNIVFVAMLVGWFIGDLFRPDWSV